MHARHARALLDHGRFTLYFQRPGMKRILLLACLFCAELTCGQTLYEIWKNPPPESRPWNFWYWLYGAMSKEGITADLEAMKENGIGGAYLFTIKGAPENPYINPSYTQLTPEWWQMVKFAIEEADRIGIEIGFHACDGWALSGGPWITPEHSMQVITWSNTPVDGGRRIQTVLPEPPSKEHYYRDIAVFAYPIRPGEGVTTDTVIPRVCTSSGADASFLAKPHNKQSFHSKEPCWIEYAFDEPFLCRNILIHTPKLNYQANRMKLQVSDDGVNYRTVTAMEPPRQSWHRRVPGTTHAIPPTRARYFRFCYDPAGSEPGIEDMDPAKWTPELNLCGIRLSSDPKIHQFEGKNGEVWRHAPRTTHAQLTDAECICPDSVLDISRFVDEKGRIDWKAPDGRWMILRMGHTSNGKKNGPAGAASGLECDKFNPEAVKLQFDSWFGRAKQIVGPEVFSRTVKIFHVDSWECGNQNWSPVFREEFRQRRGYDIVPWLPVIAGIPIGSVDDSERVLYDVRMTIAELISEHFFGTMQQCAHNNGCRFSAECVAPVTMSDGMLHYRNTDIPMGEFWFRSPTHDKPNDILDAVSGAHLYGKRIVAAEAFTEVDITWDEHPGMLKPLQDFEYANGINRLVFHVNVHNPWMNRTPGMTLDQYGLYFQRDQTWWRPGKAWMDYTVRCQALLQQGLPVVDLAVFTGDDFPRRALLPERMVAWFPGLFGPEIVEKERKRLLNEGTPMTEQQSGRTYTSNMTTPQDWVNPMHGYTYDSFNADALLRLAKVVDKRIVLPDGMSYGALVVPSRHAMQLNADRISKACADKIDEMARSGVPVLMAEPADKTFSRADRSDPIVWSQADRFIRLPYEGETLEGIGIERDFAAFEQTGCYAEKVAYRHRRTDHADIYFIANQTGRTRELTVSMRVQGRCPQLWYPVSGEIRRSVEWSEKDGRTEMPLRLAPYESLFAVLQDVELCEPEPGANWDETSPRHEITSPWSVSFGTAAEPHTAIFRQLSDWSMQDDPRIKYFSGTAVYRNKFIMPEPPVAGERYFLEIEEVYNLAEISVNGKPYGVIWTPPYRADITGAVREGDNEIEISVTNTWSNRIRGNTEQPGMDPNFWTIVPYSLDHAPMQKSGLVGKVVISTSRNLPSQPVLGCRPKQEPKINRSPGPGTGHRKGRLFFLCHI